MQDQVAVKEYISKYNLEDELSNAVNLAIKQKSDDPFLVISDYLKTLRNGADEDDDDDDDDGCIEEGQDMPVMKARGRRDQVMAPKVEIPDDYVPPSYEKSDQEMEFLKQVMVTNKLMKNLSPSDRTMLLSAFKACEFEQGVKIITQGDAGDNFYIVSSGECDISITNVGTVMKATSGLAFGELALLHNAPRAATVTALTKVSAWALDMLTFKSILMGKSKTDTKDYLGFLNSVELLNPVSESDKQTLVTSLKELEYPDGRSIICEGDEGNHFYIIRQGEVKCTKVGTKEEVSRRLKRGDFFGELALLSSDKRAATVTAVGQVSVLVIDRAAFTRLLGSLSDILKSAASVQGRN